MSLDKQASPSSYDSVGDVISYSYVVTNTGNVTLFGIAVTDNKVSVTCAPATLLPGNSVTCTASHTIAQADLDNGSITNIATASSGAVTSNQDTVTVNAVKSPGLGLTKVGALDMTVVAPSGRVDVGDKVNYTLTASNTGNVTLHGVSIV